MPLVNYPPPFDIGDTLYHCFRDEGNFRMESATVDNVVWDSVSGSPPKLRTMTLKAQSCSFRQKVDGSIHSWHTSAAKAFEEEQKIILNCVSQCKQTLAQHYDNLTNLKQLGASLGLCDSPGNITVNTN